ncbi:hypothetical protein D3C80_1752060 [compost metagenome]
MASAVCWMAFRMVWLYDSTDWSYNADSSPSLERSAPAWKIGSEMAGAIFQAVLAASNRFGLVPP